MAGEQELILELFKEIEEFSTTDIVEKFYSEELKQNNTPEARAKYHRKLIYHLNKLVENRVLKISGYKSKGEKCFRVAKDIVVELPNKKVRLSRKDHDLPGLKLDQDSVFEYGPFGIMINAVLINASFLELSQLNLMIKELFIEVNDVIAVYGMEHLIATSNNEELEHFFLGIESLLDQRKLSLLIDFNKPKAKYLNKICNILSNKKDIEIVLLLSDETFLAETKELNLLLESLKDEGIKINISENGEEINFSGKAGAYTTTINEQLIKVVTTNSVCLDLNKIKELKAGEIKDKFMRVVKGLHQVNVHQQINFENIFPIISSYKGIITNANNTIRVWNYDWKTDEYLLVLLEELKEDINKFTRSEENIYMSCGMPINFKIKIGSAFFSFDKEKLSKRHYQKEIVHGITDLKNNYKNYLIFRSKYYSLFDQGDRLRIFRDKENTKTLTQEFHYLLSSNIPYFTYDFRGMSKEINLRDFM